MKFHGFGIIRVGLESLNRIVLAGGRWKNVNVDLDSWIPGVNGLINWHHEDVKLVSDLIGDDEKWNTTLVDNTFQPEIANKIKSIYISENSQDSLIWFCKRNGQFTTKSAYKLICQENQINDVTWMKIWHMKLLPKAVLFVWKLSAEVLNFRSNLYDKLGHPDPCCVLCSSDSRETAKNLFVECCFTRAVWFGLGLQIPYFNTNCFEWVKTWFDTPLKEWKEIFAIICWKIWKYRNMVAFQAVKPNPLDYMNMIRNAINEWNTAYRKDSSGKISSSTNVTQLQKAFQKNGVSRSTHNCIRADVSYDSDTGEYGIGLILM
ncbi:uncharacterized protein LOC113296126 [Papaver somniferum]|uniref:uncharacterized protein LOC113296126 n=1 Tax=Papaver somniferum TaxID=3469 RepID=UPI000E6FF6AC|nr:uncharacterized protein LOC113296126 [Papaver somniferum]